jgi:pimeloyl-ACP methyl ester carboxylesterase
MPAVSAKPGVIRLLLKLGLVLVLLYAGACAVLWANQRSLLYYPVRTRLAQVPVEVLRRPDARVLVSVQPRPGPDAVLYFGGNAEDVSRTVPGLAAMFPGAAVYALHYRGYGGSEGEPGETALVGDALATFDRAYRGHANITVVGRSLGSGVAVQVAAARPVAKLVLVTPYDSIAAVAAAHYPAFPVDWLVRDRYDSARRAAALRVPTTLVIAEHDQVIPPLHARRLLQAFAPGVARAVTLRGVGHNDIDQAPGYVDALTR